MELDQLQRTVLEGQDLTFVETVQYVYHCHHYNLFHDQTIDDALGEARGAAIRTEAARAAFRHLLDKAGERLKPETPSERVQLAMALVPWMGHGRLDVMARADGGEARGEHLHYGHCWREKYGATVRRLDPADAVAAGFAAAATEYAYNLDPGTIAVEEATCIARRDAACTFHLTPAESPVPQPTPVGQSACSENVSPTFDGADEERIATIASGLQQFTRGVAGDERGLVHAFGVYVTMHLTSYYNQSAYETIHATEKEQPSAIGFVEALMREAGHVCVFNTFGGIMLSPEWEGMVGPLSGKIEDTISYCCAIARGLGFGHWTLGELQPDRRLVVRAPATYEAPFYRARYGQADRPRCYFFQGAAMAFMLLAHAVDWAARPKLTQELYQKLFKSGRLPWKVEETRCVARGDEMCEAIVTPNS